LTPSERFYDYVNRGEIRFQRCTSCGTLRTVPRAICHHCLGPEATWELAPPTGRIVSFFIARQPIATELNVPYAVVHVELAEGVRFTANLVGDGSPPRVGLPVSFTIVERAGRMLPQFERGEGNSATS
jgi:uncharacterized OB-fold protein